MGVVDGGGVLVVVVVDDGVVVVVVVVVVVGGVVVHGEPTQSWMAPSLYTTKVVNNVHT